MGLYWESRGSEIAFIDLIAARPAPQWSISMNHNTPEEEPTDDGDRWDGLGRKERP